MSTPSLFLISLGIFLGTGLAALPAGRRLATALGAGGAVTGGLCGLFAAWQALTGGATAVNLPWSVPGGRFALQLDPLAGFFLLPIFLLAALCAVYGVGYLAADRSRLPGGHWFLFNLLAAAMALVVTAANAVVFLFAWELMSLASFFLVATEHRRKEVRRAAWLYLLATHCGTACLFVLFLLAGEAAGSLDFADWGALSSLSGGTATLFFGLGVVGFGTKAGLFPLHVWLPDAHPAAPSHISALMSAVMVKTGLYGLLRLLTFLPPAPAWWGGLLMILGISGALFGIAMASVQGDLKRCLAYSTVENVGIMVLAIGLGIYAAGQGMPATALLATAAGLLHLWNHALFKGIMFLGAGSLVHGSGSRDLDRLGGLLRRMPVTGTLLIGGALAIAALPPLNGFVGEWLLYLGLLQAGQATGLAGFFPLLLIGLLALVGGLAVLVFTRLTGSALLGEPRSGAAAGAHESGFWMTAPMAVLLLLCLAIGVAPAAALALVLRPAGILLGGAPGLPSSVSLIDPVGRLALLLLMLLGVGVWLVSWLRRRRPVAVTATWGCGYVAPNARMQYTAAAYAELAQRHLLPGWLRPQLGGGRPAGLFPAAVRLSQKTADPVLSHFFRPLFRQAATRCQRLRFVQQGRLHIYLLYIFIACAGLLAWSVLAARGWPR